jgi:hypothetical protein
MVCVLVYGAASILAYRLRQVEESDIFAIVSFLYDLAALLQCS